MINNLSTFSQNYNQRLNKTQSFSSKENQTTSASMTNKTSMPYYEPETVPDVFEKINSSYKHTSTVNNNQKIYKSVPEAILNNKDYKKAIDYVDSENKQKKYKNVKKYVNNPDFDSLAQSKFFKDPEGKFEKLLDIVSALDKTHETSYKKVHSPFYRPKYSPDTNSLYANIDVNGCLSNLNKFSHQM